MSEQSNVSKTIKLSGQAWGAPSGKTPYIPVALGGGQLLVDSDLNAALQVKKYDLNESLEPRHLRHERDTC